MKIVKSMFGALRSIKQLGSSLSETPLMP